MSILGLPVTIFLSWQSLFLEALCAPSAGATMAHAFWRCLDQRNELNGSTSFPEAAREDCITLYL